MLFPLLKVTDKENIDIGKKIVIHEMMIIKPNVSPSNTLEADIDAPIMDLKLEGDKINKKKISYTVSIKLT